MASLWQKFLWSLGLTDDENYESAEAEVSPQAQVRTVEAGSDPSAESDRRPARTTSGVPGRRVEPPTSTRRVLSSNPQHAEAGVYVREGPSGTTTRPIGGPRGTRELSPGRSGS